MTVSPALQATFDYLFPIARKALSEGRSFAPFSTAQSQSGDRWHSQTDLNVASSTPQDHMAALLENLQKEAAAGRIKSAGMIFDTVTPFDDNKASDALCVHAETEDGEAVQIFVPYKRGGHTMPDFEQPVVQSVAARIFR